MDYASTKYLKYIPKPLLDDILQKRCIPIVGAGFSKNADIDGSETIPDWEQLGRSVAEQLTKYEYDSPIQAISAFVASHSRSRLIELLHELLLIRKTEPGKTIEAFCNLGFESVITTNFDYLLENGYSQTGRFCHVLIDEQQLGISTMDGDVRLIKVHGDLNHPDQLVATETDYDLFLTRYPMMATYITSLLITKTPLLIGYSLNDPDFRQLWQIARLQLGQNLRMAYCIKVGSNHQDEATYLRRGITLISLPRGKSYSEVLRILFEEISQAWQYRDMQASSLNQGDSQAVIKLPQDSKTNLVYFSVPQKLLGLFRAGVFPSVESVGLVPILMQDVLDRSSSIVETSKALMERSDLFVFDLDSVNSQYEYRMAQNMGKSPEDMLLISQDPANIPTDLSRYQVARYSKKSTTDIINLRSIIEEWLSSRVDKVRDSYRQEPSRLLQAGHEQAAFIAAIVLLETDLKLYSSRHLSESDSTSTRMSLMHLVSEAAKYNQLVSENMKSIRLWINMRNGLLHDPRYRVPKSKMAEAAQGILGLVDALSDQA